MSMGEGEYALAVFAWEWNSRNNKKNSKVSLSIEFSYLTWRLKYNSRPIITYTNGKLFLPSYKDDDSFYITKLKEFFGYEKLLQ